LKRCYALVAYPAAAVDNVNRPVTIGLGDERLVYTNTALRAVKLVGVARAGIHTAIESGLAAITVTGQRRRRHFGVMRAGKAGHGGDTIRLTQQTADGVNTIAAQVVKAATAAIERAVAKIGQAFFQIEGEIDLYTAHLADS